MPARTSGTRTTYAATWSPGAPGEAGCPLAYVNLVGGQDELVFDGDTMIVTARRDDRGARRCSSSRSWSSPTLSCGDGHRSRTARAPPRWPGQSGMTIHSAPSSPKPARHPLEMITSGDHRADARAGRGVVRAGDGPAGLLPQERHRAGLPRTVRRDRLDTGRRRWPATPSAPRTSTASPIPAAYSSEHSKTDAAELAERTGLNFRRFPSPRPSTPSTPMHRHRRHRRREPAGADPRRDLDGRVQPARPLDRAGLRQQERAGRRATAPSTATPSAGYAPIKDVPKTWVWKLARWRNDYAVAHGRNPADPGELDHQGTERRAPAGTEGHRLAAAVRAARRHPRRLRRRRRGPRGDRRPWASTPRWWTG